MPRRRASDRRTYTAPTGSRERQPGTAGPAGLPSRSDGTTSRRWMGTSAAARVLVEERLVEERLVEERLVEERLVEELEIALPPAFF